MVAWHDDPRYVRQALEKLERCGKLVRFGALCQIAADNDHVWIEPGRNFSIAIRPRAGHREAQSANRRCGGL